MVDQIKSVYSLEEIIGRRFNAHLNREEFLVKWLGWPSSYNTWEPREHLLNCEHKIQQFEFNVDQNMPVYLVDEIVDKRFNKELNRVEYLVKWFGWQSSNNTWEPREHLLHCEYKIRCYEESQMNLKNPKSTRQKLRKITQQKNQSSEHHGQMNRLEQEIHIKKKHLCGGNKNLFVQETTAQEYINKQVCSLEEMACQKFNTQLNKENFLVKSAGTVANSNSWELEQNLAACKDSQMNRSILKSVNRKSEKGDWQKNKSLQREDSENHVQTNSFEQGIHKNNECLYSGDSENGSAREIQKKLKKERKKSSSAENLKNHSQKNGDEREIQKGVICTHPVECSKKCLNGFDRGWTPIEIVGAIKDVKGLIYFLIRFKEDNVEEVIPSKVARHFIPQMIIEFYDKHRRFVLEERTFSGSGFSCPLMKTTHR